MAVQNDALAISEMIVEWADATPTEKFGLIQNEPVQYRIVTTSVQRLGFPQGATRWEIYAAAHKHHLGAMPGFVAVRFMHRVEMSMSKVLYVTHGPQGLVAPNARAYGHHIDWAKGSFNCVPDVAAPDEHLPPEALIAFARL